MLQEGAVACGLVRWTLPLLVLALLAGCSSPAPPPTTAPPQDLSMERIATPTFAPTAGGISIVWNFSATWTRAAPSGELNVTLLVKLYDRTPVGTDAVSASFAPAEERSLRMRSAFVGPGDYYFHLNATDASGKLVGAKVGVWETCLC